MEITLNKEANSTNTTNKAHNKLPNSNNSIIKISLVIKINSKINNSNMVAIVIMEVMVALK